MRSTSAGAAVWVSIVAVLSGLPGDVAASPRSFAAAAPVRHQAQGVEPPIATIDQPATDVTIFAGGSVNFAGSWNDPDGGLGVITFVWTFPSCASPPSTGIEDPGPVSFSCAPGDHVVTFEVCDDDGLCDTDQRTITVQSTNVAPAAAITGPSSNVTVLTDAQVSFASTASDPDGPPPLSFAWTFPACASPSSSSAEDPGLVTFACADGNYSVTLEVCDGQGACTDDSVGVTVTSNFSPVASIDAPAGNVTILAGHQVLFEGTGTDANGPSPLTFSWTFAACAVPAVSADEDPGAVQFDCESGDYPAVLQVCDGLNACVSTSVTVTVVADLPPVATIVQPASDVTVAAGGSVTFAGAWSDEDGGLGAITFAWTFPPCADAPTTAVEDPGGVVFLCPVGDYVVTFEVCEQGGLCGSDSRTVTVETPSSAPTASIDLPSGATAQVSAGGSLSFSGTGTDADGPPPLSFTWTFPACAAPSISHVEDPGRVVFACSPDDYTVTLQVCDAAAHCAFDTLVVTVIPQQCTTIPRAGFSVHSFDSQETAGENGRAARAIDGIPSTIWHTRWSGANPPAHPHYIALNLGAQYDICGFSYLPRQTGSTNGTIRDYEFAVSPDGVGWTTVASGVLVTQAADRAEKHVEFAITSARFVRLTATSEVNGYRWTSAAEITVQGVVPSASLPPTATIDEPPSTVAIGQGDAVSFAGSASDPDNEFPLTLQWTFPSCASPSSSILEDPGSVVFDCAPGDYPVSFEVCDDAGLCDTASRTVTVLGEACTVLPQGGFSLVFADSQELAGENGAAVNAFDGNALTNWVTQWVGAQPSPPHEIRIDTGTPRTLCGFSYLPRQDGGVNGTIRDYEFAVSLDGSAWTTVSGGVLVSNPANLSERAVSFSPTAGRFVRLRALSEVNGGPWTSVAEIKVSAGAGGSLPPTAVIVTPPGNATVAVGGAVTFTGTAADADAELPLDLTWTFPACAVPAISHVEDPGPVVFQCAPGDYGVSFEVCDAGDLCATANRTVTVLAPGCTLLSQAGFSLVFADSQELIGENGAAVNAFDGDPGTIWHTRWTGSNTPAHPHEIRIDTGAARTLCGFSYLPRQDGGVNGTIRNYEFAVSLDGAAWTTVSSGILVATSADLSERVVEFSATSGRYIRLRALSSVNGGRFTSAAELRVKGAP